MRKMSKAKLQKILTSRLKLKRPAFRILDLAGMLCGHVISDTFKNKSDLERQRMLRGALEAELGFEGAETIGTLLAYTPDEWEWGSELDPIFDAVANRRPARSGKSRRARALRT
jgi:acid stress-induced BolA-like protein IbaG/YrbA